MNIENQITLLKQATDALYTVQACRNLITLAKLTGEEIEVYVTRQAAEINRYAMLIQEITAPALKSLFEND